MYSKLTQAILFAFMIPAVCCAQHYRRTSNGLKANIGGNAIDIEFYSPSIVRVVKSPISHSFKKESLSVIEKPEKVVLTIGDHGDVVALKSNALEADLNWRTGVVSFKKLSGQHLFTEKEAGQSFTPVSDNGKATYQVKQSFVLDTADVFYGLGQQQNGKLSQRNQKVFLQQGNTRVCIPFFQSIKGYGIFWDNYSPTTFTDNKEETSFDSQRGDCIDYYVMYGGNIDGVVARMRELTGQAPMKPLWALGYIQSRERYKTQFELMDVVKKYRELQVPLDGIVQDWQYWGPDSNWNAMAFDKKVFPRPKAMIDSVHEMNAHLFIVSWPGFAPATPQYKEFDRKHMLINFDTWPPKANTKPYDVYNPQARDIYWSYLNKGVFSLGPDAWWLDSTEPDHINVKEADWDQPTYLGTYRNWINAFPLEHTKGVYEHQRQTTDQKRVILLTRSAFAGQQRYGSDTWSGDVVSTWATLKKQIPASLNFSMTGLPYWNGDIGGFFANGFGKEGTKNPKFQDLYTRWFQFATFTPMMRSHGTELPREIYQFGNRGDWAFDVLEKFINLRYRLLPYNYATVWNVTHHAGSFLRPLVADFANDPKVADLNTEFMSGKSLLVAPVTDPEAQTKSVYLPAGASWFDFWTGKVISGGQTIDRESPRDIIPLYVKAGSIIPWGPKVQYAQQKKWDDLEIRIYPGANADFTLYEDEGDSYNYEKGQYTEIRFHWNDKAQLLTISNRAGAFNGALQNRTFRVVKAPAGIDNANAAKAIKYTGKEVSFKL